MSEDFSYLQSKGIATLDDLDEVVAGIGEDVMDRMKAIRDQEGRMKELAAELRRFYQCRRILDEQLNDDGKLPYPKWQKELKELKEAHDADYAAMKATRDELFRIQKLQQNLRSVLRQNERPGCHIPDR